MASKDYWFKRRRYGYGWIPVTWQGWAVVFVYLAVVLLSGLILVDVPDNEFTAEVGVFFTVLAVATVQLIVICSKNGPKPKWRWGKSPDDDPDKDF